MLWKDPRPAALLRIRGACLANRARITAHQRAACVPKDSEPGLFKNTDAITAIDRLLACRSEKENVLSFSVWPVNGGFWLSCQLCGGCGCVKARGGEEGGGGVAGDCLSLFTPEVLV